MKICPFAAIRSATNVLAALLLSLLAVPRLSADVPPPEAFANESQRIRIVLADRILDSLDGRDWLFSGTLDFADDIVSRAKARGLPLRFVDRRLPLLPDAVQAEIAARGEEFSDAAAIAPLLLARLLMERDPDWALAHVALLEAPEIWRTVGLDYVPSGIAYLGAGDAENAPDALDRRAAAATAFWDETSEFLLDSEAEATSPEASEQRRWLRFRVSRAANETGALLEAAGRLEAAFDAYSRALRFERGNLPAFMNRSDLVFRHHIHDGLQSEILAETERRNAESLPEPVRLSLGALYGPALHPATFVAIGWHWALNAVPRSNPQALEEGLECVRVEARDQVRKAILSTQGRQIAETDTSREFLRRLHDPEQRRAAALDLYALASIMAARGEPAADALLARWRATAEGAGASPADFTLADVARLVEAKDGDGARALLQRALATDSSNVRLWRALLGLQAGDAAALARTAAALRLLETPPLGVADLADAMLASAAKRPADSRAAYVRALAAFPGDIAILSALLPLDMQERAADDARAHAKALLERLPDHALANYILGSLAYGEGDFETAADHLRRSVISEATPHALNDYACALNALRRYDQAVVAIHAALQSDPANPALLDTLAEALIGLERWDDAAEAMDKATAALPAGEGGPIRLREAQILLHKGDTEGAVRALRDAERAADTFSASDARLRDQLKEALKME